MGRTAWSSGIFKGSDMEHSHREWCRQGTCILFASESLGYRVDILLRNYFIYLEGLIAFNMILYLVTLKSRNEYMKVTHNESHLTAMSQLRIAYMDNCSMIIQQFHSVDIPRRNHLFILWKPHQVFVEPFPEVAVPRSRINIQTCIFLIRTTQLHKSIQNTQCKSPSPRQVHI